MSIKGPGSNPMPVAANPEIVCPVIRGMVNDGHLQVDGEGNAKISELKDIFEDLGMSRIGANAAIIGNKPLDIFGNLFSQTFNVNDLRGGMLDHSGDSMILREGKFDPERFEKLVSFSSDGKTMSLDDFKKAIPENRKDDDGSWLGAKISGVEFSILTDAFGVEDADGVKRIDINDLRNLYEHKQIPPNFRPETRAVAETSVSSMAGRARGLASGSQVGMAQSGINSALGGDDLFSSGDIATQGAGKGVCPHMGQAGAETTSASSPEVTQLHNQLNNNPGIEAK